MVLNLGWIQGGDNLVYNLNVEQAGDYEMDLRYASPTGATGVRVLVDQTEVLSVGNLASTGGWQEWKTLRIGSIPMEAGTRSLKLEFLSSTADDLNLNRITLFPALDAVHRFLQSAERSVFLHGISAGGSISAPESSSVAI